MSNIFVMRNCMNTEQERKLERCTLHHPLARTAHCTEEYMCNTKHLLHEISDLYLRRF